MLASLLTAIAYAANVSLLLTERPGDGGSIVTKTNIRYAAAHGYGSVSVDCVSSQEECRATAARAVLGAVQTRKGADYILQLDRTAFVSNHRWSLHALLAAVGARAERDRVVSPRRQDLTSQLLLTNEHSSFLPRGPGGFALLAGKAKTGPGVSEEVLVWNVSHPQMLPIATSWERHAKKGCQRTACLNALSESLRGRLGSDTSVQWLSAAFFHSTGQGTSNGHFARTLTGEQCVGNSACAAEAVAEMKPLLAEDGGPAVHEPACTESPLQISGVSSRIRKCKVSQMGSVVPPALLSSIDFPVPAWQRGTLRPAADFAQWKARVRQRYSAETEFCVYTRQDETVPRSAQDCEHRDIIHSLFWGMTDGVILELGGLDGVAGPSQSLPLLQMSGWKRVLVEGDLMYVNNRKKVSPDAVGVAAVVCSIPGKVHYLHGNYRVVNGIGEFMHADFMSRFHKETWAAMRAAGVKKCVRLKGLPAEKRCWKDVWANTVFPANRSTVMECQPLHTILQAALGAMNRRTHADLAIIDVEGAELSVLDSIDWDRFAPSVLCVETQELLGDMSQARPAGFTRQVIDLILKKSKGRYRVMWHKRGRNTWFVHRSFKPSSDPEPPYKAPNPDVLHSDFYSTPPTKVVAPRRPPLKAPAVKVKP
eukprot:TRINITY_DN12499_c0_g1_i1.p1 TRINITY_DN12499_c0_g1~~TRINITY_DN12499_c0_g1_i1.p1  ORF type:complete len:650 (+),score=104.01 TRINITY_DN12499_c0_g1_i1:68-2017(+)